MPPNPDPETEPVGSIAEETAKLVAALGEWVRSRGAMLGSQLDDLGNGAECAGCPFCQLLGSVGRNHPELLEQVRTAMAAFCQTVQGLIDDADEQRRARSTTGFQTIDLDDPEGT